MLDYIRENLSFEVLLILYRKRFICTNKKEKGKYLETNIQEYLCSYTEMSLLIVLALKLTKSSNTMAEAIIVTIFKC